MEMRLNYRQASPTALQAMLAFDQAARNSSVDKVLYEYVKLRVSQVNGCAFCVDSHSRDLLKLGESLDKVLLVSAWHDAPHFTEKERAILELAEHVTRVSEVGVPQRVYDAAMEFCTEGEYVDWILAINVINAWNRVSISTGMFPGCYS
ncbi:carboxymuconolactone decarboxylase family protein [Paenibacillus athensensis]|uniref:Alkylhydroperoxidase n=1 Tax=Paenibacillus athensensis TaxID=1967502 RepID=A0A4Y8Q961_9BACL|nr:carboxymuconolactone decarboxylase family protein [Paenibacillus athensensis]MCD1260142.1 carboxymuconolactone decarboxylase family protein [Paenibacillus athensensis]